MKSILRKDERGVAAFLVILILLFLLVAGYAGWSVWQSNSKTDTDQTQSEPAAESTEKEAEPEEATTVSASPASDAYSVERPSEWLERDCGEANPNILFIAPTEELLGKCATEFFGLISISTTTGDAREPESAYVGRTDISDVTYAVTEVDSMDTVRVSYVQSEEPIVGPPVGTTYVTIIAYDGVQSYIIGYNQYPDWDSYLTEFNELASSFTLSTD